MVIHYRRPNEKPEEPDTIVKIKLWKNSDDLEFDVFFARIAQLAAIKGMEVTINWQSLDFDNKGIFYTDSNAYKVVKRDIYKKLPYNESREFNQTIVASYFYPINSLIFVENPTTSQTFGVLTSQPQGGSAYMSSRIELVLIRQTNSQDELGIWETMRDWSADGMGANITQKLKLVLADGREQLYRTAQINHASSLASPLQFYSLQYKEKNATTAPP